MTITAEQNRRLTQVGPHHRLEAADGAEASRLFAHQVDQLGPHDAAGEAGVVLDVGGDGELAAGL